MKIDLDRLARLAGISGGSASTLNESIDEKMHHGDEKHETMSDTMEGMYHEEDMDEGMYHEEDMDEAMYEEDLDEEIEIDEVMLVQELRRAKSIMAESRKRQERKAQIEKRRAQRLQEAQLKLIIEDEVQNVMRELNLNSQWVYGKNQPKKSKEGYVHQGSMLKGLGFK